MSDCLNRPVRFEELQATLHRWLLVKVQGESADI